ncbi:hypothetical protein ACFVTZ_13605 [Cellulosimicrobium cellulans]|uniref:hypothetical protein n=1 Tax=Cellulosimicrobium cellulans TaxID=1710 RepID=UPI0036ED38C4
MVPDDLRDDRDRRAVETIVGVALPRAWPRGAWPAGTRVRVVHDRAWRGPWLQEFAGTVSAMAAPQPIQSPHAEAGELEYWVQFDQPQRNADGDGPYRKALIWDRHLVADADQTRPRRVPTT